jgi:hypothetical protein
MASGGNERKLDRAFRRGRLNASQNSGHRVYVCGRCRRTAVFPQKSERPEMRARLECAPCSRLSLYDDCAIANPTRCRSIIETAQNGDRVIANRKRNDDSCRCSHPSISTCCAVGRAERIRRSRSRRYRHSVYADIDINPRTVVSGRCRSGAFGRKRHNCLSIIIGIE